MATTSGITTTDSDFMQLELSSANGPIYKRVKRTPPRDAREGEIPVIDISGMFSASLEARKAVADNIYTAATTIGFFYICNHGIPDTLSKTTSEAALEFFRQPAHAKEPINTKYIEGYDGWKPSQTQRINASESIDQREMFSITYDPQNDPTITDISSIPPEVTRCLRKGEFPWEKTATVPNFRDSVLEYDRACLHLARCLTRTFALSLSLPEEYFDDKVKYPDTSLGMNYYPPLTQTPRPDTEEVSIGSHTDFQLFTMVSENRRIAARVFQ